jgi:hypothetical protein
MHHLLGEDQESHGRGKEEGHRDNLAYLSKVVKQQSWRYAALLHPIVLEPTVTQVQQNWSEALCCDLII